MSYDEEPQEQQIRTQPYMAPMDLYGNAIIHMTETDREIRELELTFKNNYIDENGTEQSLGEPLMNDIGIKSVTGQIKSVVNRITIMSNLKEQEISQLMQYITRSLVYDLMLNRIKYEIAFENRTKIVSSTLTLVHNCLKRSQNGDDKRFWKGSTQTIEHTTTSNQRRNGGFAERFMGWNK